MSFWQVVGALCLVILAAGVAQLILWVAVVSLVTYARKRARRAA